MDRFSVFFVVLIIVTVSSAEEDKLCYTQGEVAGIVIATFFVTLVVASLAVFAFRRFAKKRKGIARNEAEDSPTKKVIPELDSKYAFDNPYFRDDEVDRPTPDDAEKGQAGVIADNGVIIQPNSTAQQLQASKNKKLKPSKNHPFSSVFHGVKKQRSRDDTYLAVEPEIISVPLRGHDFTGLGFNICGNMRDGIFVKDVLHHGPASESGKIKAGDRILSVTISFNNMVYEDALTILSYASPYNVHLELEKATEKSHVVATASPGKRLGSVSFRSGGQRLFHPLYRSQSIDDLTQIGKEPGLNQELAPKRSQSIGLSANQKPPRPHLRNADSLPEETDRPLAILTATGSLDERSLPVVNEDVIQQESSPVSLAIAEEPRNEAESLQLSKNKNEKPENDENDYATPDDVHMILAPTNDPPKPDSDKEEEKPPLPYPRKGGTPGKRKAPAPPKLHKLNSSETTAQVHQVESSETDVAILVSSEDTAKLNDSLDRGLLQLKDPEEVDSLERSSLREETQQNGSQSDVSNDSLEMAAPEEHKRKSSSLGDLTKLDDVASKMSPTLLERAVSLDLKQESIPDSNLVLQKKILKPPDFDEGDSTETDLSLEQDSSNETNLKKWHHNDEEIVNKSSNGDAKMEDKKNDMDYETASEPSTSSHSPTLSTASSIADDTQTLTSTPIKKVIQADSSLTVDITQNPQQKNGGVENKSISFLTKNSEGTPVSVEIPVIPPVIKQLEKRDHPSTPVVLQPYQASNLSQQKEVIEISEKELDNIMMSHKQFLLKQAKATGVYSTLNPDPKTDAEIEFESWSYDEQNAKVNGNGSSTPSSHYNTALDITPPALSDADSAPLWKQAEVSKYDDAPLWKQADLPREYTVRTSEGGITKTVLITSSGDIPPTDSEPPQLQPPYN